MRWIRFFLKWSNVINCNFKYFVYHVVWPLIHNWNGHCCLACDYWPSSEEHVLFVALFLLHALVHSNRELHYWHHIHSSSQLTASPAPPCPSPHTIPLPSIPKRSNVFSIPDFVYLAINWLSYSNYVLDLVHIWILVSMHRRSISPRCFVWLKCHQCHRKNSWPVFHAAR